MNWAGFTFVGDGTTTLADLRLVGTIPPIFWLLDCLIFLLLFLFYSCSVYRDHLTSEFYDWVLGLGRKCTYHFSVSEISSLSTPFCQSPTQG